MNIVAVLRWGAVPLAFVVGYLVYLLLLSGLRVAVGSVGGINPDAVVGQFLAIPLPAAVASAVSVYLGTVIAPAHKHRTTTVLFVLVVAIALLIGLPAVFSQDPYTTLFRCGGNVFGAYATREILRFNEH